MKNVGGNWDDRRYVSSGMKGAAGRCLKRRKEKKKKKEKKSEQQQRGKIWRGESDRGETKEPARLDENFLNGRSSRRINLQKIFIPREIYKKKNEKDR